MTENLQNSGTPSQDGLGSYSMISRVCAYWSSLREDGAIPKRSAIDAAALGVALPHIFLAEMITPRIAKMRICGHQIEDLQGLDMRGMPVAALFMSEARGQLSEALAQVALGARVTLSLKSAKRMGQPEMTATLALLPLADPAGKITRVLGVLERQGAVGQLPRRFDLATPLQLTRELPVTNAPMRPALRVIQGGKV
ncbi:PAS domain-containing protein [Roseinatronobacter bogoriensis]|uniref:PAS domain-containing protein n=1 Tax=Roseinatronobacter bogoriensis subsp. barguzinensis TaxID=441209 RepID=A0A2K8KBA9_9RHOB|nr:MULTISPECIES: PAS domain-containing protein [Rhodobaca]ATX66721.1 PAS domain-containing protein [Rhodobaca barguzinensis]MBB4206178.1 hypothetical protein [Rhodobaca bogoriensis DSM 18756]TDW40922.1 PAS domain-containing protein [Rhodobaca barguzinensis]TDY74900.1 PAS domain-containing protein [Rhodobaca bogoriensis DSM 18756]